MRITIRIGRGQNVQAVEGNGLWEFLAEGKKNLILEGVNLGQAPAPLIPLSSNGRKKTDTGLAFAV